MLRSGKPYQQPTRQESSSSPEDSTDDERDTGRQKRRNVKKFNSVKQLKNTYPYLFSTDVHSSVLFTPIEDTR